MIVLQVKLSGRESQDGGRYIGPLVLFIVFAQYAGGIAPKAQILAEAKSCPMRCDEPLQHAGSMTIYTCTSLLRTTTKRRSIELEEVNEADLTEEMLRN